MRNLFLVDGAAGSGKTDFFNFINGIGSETNNFAIALPKYTTRERRNSDANNKDLIHFDGSREEREKAYLNKMAEIKSRDEIIFEYQYPTGEAYYSIEKSSIDKALKKYKNVYIIIRSSYCIREIVQTYKSYNNINIVPIFIYSDKDCVIDRLTDELNTLLINLSKEEKETKIQYEINKRVKRTNVAMEDYYTQPTDIYKEIVINNSNRETYIRQMRTLLEKYNTVFKDNTAFIIMPMLSKKDDNYSINESVKNRIIDAADNVGFKASRSDSILDFNKKLIIKKVYDAIEESQICIVDLSYNRPNCYLELGYARALNKVIILISQNRGSVEFDEAGYDCFEYDTSKDGLDRLERYIQERIRLWKEEHLL
ncbi:MAG: hypothetical protein NC310_06940 [Roseburia sp.]|nr:hypothetical protein [Anaeroplasma bactoclasticum]MCM1196784.1 hypothetical protein [Roseburia sp.]MCM1557194.1 hypothetical protein [Anaeroplasma bactoclasticum]